jgi:hypothetical protein
LNVLPYIMGYIEGGNEQQGTFPATQPLMMWYAEKGKGKFVKMMELCVGTVGPGRYCSPHHTIPFNSRNEGLKMCHIRAAIHVRPQGAGLSDPQAPTDQYVSVAVAGVELLAAVGFEAGPGGSANHISVTSLSTNHMRAFSA